MAGQSSHGMISKDTYCSSETLRSKDKSEELQNAERIRVQELLRYLQPYEAAAPKTSKARVATDPTLTAFAQLCALRLDCDRSFISLMDDSHQYIIAEATRTVSLTTEDTHDTEDDALYLGQTILDFEWGVCPGTIACFTSTDNSLNLTTEYIKATRNHYVMNDMSQLDDFKSRPYIAGWPYMKYYAEVPIHSPSGLTIGTLCVVDNKPRAGLDLKGLVVLEEISTCVMNHLELCVSKIQRNNAERMIHALGQFVQGNGNVKSVRQEEEQAQRLPKGQARAQQYLEKAESSQIDLRSYIETTDQSSSIELNRHEKRDIAEGSSSDPIPKAVRSSEPLEAHMTRETKANQGSKRNTATSDVLRTPQAMPQMLNHNKSNLQASGVMPSETASDLEILLSRATNLIREGIELQGILFLDPRNSQGRLMTDRKASTGSWSQLGRARSGSPGVQGHVDLDTSSLDSKNFCKVLGSSLDASCGPCDMPQVPEESLHYLLKSFPKGGVLHFDKDGLIGQSDSVFVWDQQHPEHSSSLHTITVPENRSDAHTLRESFPGATSIMLFPLWDISKDKWFAYCIAWTTNPNRTLRREDFAYLSSFGNSIMAEISRLDIVAADQAKAGFIASISHELLSPAHGVMASVEMLYDLTPDPTSFEIIRTIQSCGSTLLETMDNLLTFAKVHRLSAAKDKLLDRSQKVRSNGAVVDLAVLVEDTIQVCVTGQSFRKSVEMSSGSVSTLPIQNRARETSSGLSIVCDIEPDSEWVFETDIGIWKRIVMNLLGNSMKYTTAGSIQVSLMQADVEKHSNEVESLSAEVQGPQNEHYAEQFSFVKGDDSAQRSTYSRKAHFEQASSLEHPPRLRMSESATSPSSSRIILSVEDTGKGISSEYMAHHLFKPFYQEDNMSPGTGLGLSIVSQLISSIGGVVNVASEVGIGTTVTVECTVERSRSTSKQVHETSESFPYPEIKLGVFGLNAAPEMERISDGILDSNAKSVLAVRSSLLNCAKRLQLSITDIKATHFDDFDIVFITQADYRTLQGKGRIPVDKRFVVLVDKFPAPVLEPYATLLPPTILPKPFGPRRFRQVLELALASSALPQTLGPTLSSPPVVDRLLSTQSSSISETSQPVLSQPLSADGRLSVLLVEDNAINLKLLIMAMKKIGHAYSTATDGSQALQAYIEGDGKFDTIVMDIQMPVMNGLEASREIRRWEKEKGMTPTIIIALTALTSKEAEERALDAGVDRFVNKPMSMKKLKELLNEVTYNG